MFRDLRIKLTLIQLHRESKKIASMLPFVDVTRPDTRLVFHPWYNKMLNYAYSQDKTLRQFAFGQLEKLQEIGFHPSKTFVEAIVASKDLNVSKALISLIESPIIFMHVQDPFPRDYEPESISVFLSLFSEKILELSAQLTRNSDAKSVSAAFITLSKCYDLSVLINNLESLISFKQQLLNILLSEHAVEIINHFFRIFTLNLSLAKNHLNSDPIDSDISSPSINLILDHISNKRLTGCIPALIGFRDSLFDAGMSVYPHIASTTLLFLGYNDHSPGITN